jgi:hypothetical protein
VVLAMTDFTKEELECIYLNLCVNDKTTPVMRKLEMMIEDLREASPNCEHKIDVESYIFKNQSKCTKCGDSNVVL